MKLLWLLSCVCVTYTSCFSASNELNLKKPDEASLRTEKILGGRFTLISDLPHQAAFEYDRKFKFGATIISSTWLISAAHIWKYCNEYSARGAIRTGSSFRERDGRVFRIRTVILHPRFDDDIFANDLSLIKVASPIRFNRNQQPIDIARHYTNSLTGRQMLESGFGQIQGSGASSELKSSSVRVISYRECSDIYDDIQSEEKIFCTTGRACSGDAGGAVIYGRELYGIISIGYSCIDSDFRPTIAMKLKEYYPWITKYVNLRH